jgi:hypothetical protein
VEDQIPSHVGRLPQQDVVDRGRDDPRLRHGLPRTGERRLLRQAVEDLPRLPVRHGGLRAALGHSDADVTDLYIKPSFEDALAALNRAALLIDGEEQENVAIFRGANGIGSEMAGKMANGRVSA